MVNLNILKIVDYSTQKTLCKSYKISKITVKLICITSLNIIIISIVLKDGYGDGRLLKISIFRSVKHTQEQ